MTHKNDRAERRSHQRFTLVEGMIEPITISLEDATSTSRSQPAIMTNLSAGGMSLVMFAEPPHTRMLDMVLSIPGLEDVPIEAKVVRVLEKGQTYNVGIAFTKISKKHQSKINGMAQDHADCETRISLGLPEACVQTCTFHEMCMKTQKSPFWPKKKPQAAGKSTH